MTNLVSFEFDGYQIRVLQDDDGELLFVAKDVAEALGYVWKGAGVISNVPAEWRGLRSVQTVSGMKEVSVLTHHGLQFFLAGSDKPGAIPLHKKVAKEILPAIRKTGSCCVEPPTNPPQDFAYRDVVPLIDANRLFRSNLSVAELLFDGDQALLSANQATLNATGVDVLGNLGATHVTAQ